MYPEWREYRHSLGLEHIVCDLDDISTISQDSVTFALCRFITEVKKLDGLDFPGKTLYDIIVCVQFYLDLLGFNWKLINEEYFKDVKFTLDNMMKIQTVQGIGISVKKAQILSHTDEDLLWSVGLLGTHNPDVLLNTVVFMIGKGCALHAGKKHHLLRAPPFRSQFEFVKEICFLDIQKILD